MKKIIPAALFLFAFQFFAYSARSQDAYKGSVTTLDNVKKDGSVRESLKKGTIAFTGSNGEKKIYSPSEVICFEINGASYISYAGDFYKKVVDGNKARLFQRVTDNSGKMLYNGSEAVMASTADGKSGDMYLQLNSGDNLQLISKRNAEDVLGSAFAGCAAVMDLVKGKQIDMSQLAKLVEQYNSCN